MIQSGGGNSRKANKAALQVTKWGTDSLHCQLLLYTANSGLPRFLSVIQSGGGNSRKANKAPLCGFFISSCLRKQAFAASEMKKAKQNCLAFPGRDDWIRTSDHTHPMRVFYQAELHPEIIFSIRTSGHPASGGIFYQAELHPEFILFKKPTDTSGFYSSFKLYSIGACTTLKIPN